MHFAAASTTATTTSNTTATCTTTKLIVTDAGAADTFYSRLPTLFCFGELFGLVCTEIMKLIAWSAFERER